MEKSVIFAFLFVATVASMTNAEVTWGVPPIILTAEGEKAGFSEEGGQYFYPEENQNFQNLTDVSVVIMILFPSKPWGSPFFNLSFILEPLMWT